MHDFLDPRICGKKDEKQKYLAKRKNDFVFANELAKNILDAINGRYRFTGLPNTISERVLKCALLKYGCAFFFEKEGNVLCLPGLTDGSGINVQGDFAGAYVYGPNGYNEHIDLFLPGSDESAFLKRTMSGQTGSRHGGVMVRENHLLYPFFNDTMYYAERQADTLRKIETACKNAATPYMVVAEESVVPTVKEYFKKRDNNEEYIISSGIFPVEKVSLLPFDIQADSIRAMTGVYDWYCNRYRERCGVRSSTNLDKKGENLTNAEINITADYTDQSKDQTIETIQEGLDLVNKLYGTDIHVLPLEGAENDDVSGVENKDAKSLPDGDPGRSATDN